MYVNMWKLKLQVQLLAVSWSLACLVGGGRQRQNLIGIWIVFLVVGEISAYCIIRATDKWKSEAIDRCRNEVDIPLEEAKAYVLERFSQENLAFSARRDLTAEEHKRMPKSVCSFFAQYESVVLGNTRLDLNLVGDSRCRFGFTRIGGNDEIEIAVCSQDERVWELEGNESEEEFRRGGYQSIWHFLYSALK